MFNPVPAGSKGSSRPYRGGVVHHEVGASHRGRALRRGDPQVVAALVPHGAQA